jgi:hypothetical protein
VVTVTGLRKSWLFWTALLLAVAMLILMLIPAELWHHPLNDAVYRGFDRELVVASQQSYPAPEQGLVDISPGSLKLTALPNSQPAVTLLTTPLGSFRAAMDVRVLQNPEASEPLRIGIWSARAKSGYFLVFGPSDLIAEEMIEHGSAARTLVGGAAITGKFLGSYSPGLAYHVEMALDKSSGVITSHITRRDTLPAGGTLLRLVGGPSDPAYGDVLSEDVPIEAGKTYDFGGVVDAVSGGDNYKLAVEWLDADRRSLSFTNGWRTVQELRGRTEKRFTGVAPAGAAIARLNLGSANDTQLLFGNLFLREADSSANLLANGDFHSGAQGWMLANRPSEAPQIIAVAPVSIETTATAADIPGLFDSLRLSLTASATSTAGNSAVQLLNYSLTLPHERWQVAKIDDPRATALVGALLIAGALLGSISAVTWVRKRARSGAGAEYRGRTPAVLRRPITIAVPSLGLIIAAGAVMIVFLVLNVLLFNLGSLPFDMLAAKLWSYLAATSGPAALYLQPNILSLAKVWGGIPYHEAVFPYDFPMAYYFAAIGWIYRVFLSGPGALQADTYQLEFLIKSFNVLFNLADAALIYLILRQLRTSRAWSLVAGCLFLFNPAVWFSTSVWGQNHVVSIFFLLVAIWLVEKKQPVWAWLALVATSLTRPQMLVPAFLLGLVFLRNFSFKQNLHAITWSVIITFLAMAPFALTYGPSMPLDLLRNDLQVQEAGGNEPELTTVSLNAYSIWPLVDRFASEAQGLTRFSQSSEAPFIGRLSYQRAGQLLTIAAMLFIGLLLVVRPRGERGPGDYLPLLALGTFGFLMFTTGVAGTHFVLGLPLLILCRRALGKLLYGWCIGVWTVTTLVAMYGAFGFSITAALVPALDAGRNPVTRFFMDLSSTDWFISVASFQNIVVLLCLGFVAVPRIPANWLWRIGLRREARIG